MADLIFKDYSPSDAEKARRSHVEARLQAMSTPYRQAAIEMAKLGRAATDGIVMETDRVSNAQLIKIPISNAVVMQRLSTLMDNPSRAIYRSPTTNRSRLTVAEQLNEYDKIAGRYSASYHDFMRTSEVEGTCFVKQGWHEEFRKMGGKRVTVGKFFCSQEKVLVEDFWWDPSANELRGDQGVVANDAINRQYMSVRELRRRYAFDKNWKNVLSVKPMNSESGSMGSKVYDETWFQERKDDHGKEIAPTLPSDPSRECVLWHYYCRNFYNDETGMVEDKYLVYCNGVEIRNDSIPVPKIKGKAVLPFLKFVAIPTSGMCGVSMPALIRHPEKCLQRMVTLADTQAEMSQNPIQFMSSSVMDTLDQTPLYPGARVEVAMQGRTIADEIYFHQAPDMTNGASFIIEKMLQFITLITGVDISALFESPRTKAISTERKREIQEKLLRYSVTYNEAHGFYDLEELRLLMMLKNYPVKRYMLTVDDEGKEHVEQKYPEIPVQGFVVKVVDGDLDKSDDARQYSLEKSSRSFDILTINPASIEYDIHLFIQGATEASNDDSFKLNRSIEKMNLLATNPWTAQTVDPLKASSEVFDMLNLDEDRFIKESLEKSSKDMHGAMKEVQALMLKDLMEIPLRVQDDYDPKEYVDVFARFMQLGDFQRLSVGVRQAMMERYQFHLKNSLNPFWREQMRLEAAQQAETEQAAAQANQEAVGNPTAGPTAVRTANQAKVLPQDSHELSQQVDSIAGRLGKAGKGRAALSKTQRRKII